MTTGEAQSDSHVRLDSKLESSPHPYARFSLQIETEDARRTGNPKLSELPHTADLHAFRIDGMSDEPTRSNNASAQPKDLTERVNDARYPRIGQAWNDASPLGNDHSVEAVRAMRARHDLFFAAPEALLLNWKTDPSTGAQGSHLA